jgi:hypothetical protein
VGVGRAGFPGELLAPRRFSPRCSLIFLTGLLLTPSVSSSAFPA